MIMASAGGKHLTGVMFMPISGFGTVSYACLPRVRNRVSVCERAGAGTLGSGFCSVAGFSVCLGRSRPFSELGPDS